MSDNIKKMGQRARTASQQLAALSTQEKNSLLERYATTLDKNRNEIIRTNQLDIDAGKANNLSEAMLDRLQLTSERIDAMIQGIHDIIALEDPINEELSILRHPDGMIIRKIRVPIGVIAMIYESRPNVTVDVSVLCIKTSNAIILRGGKEAIHSNSLLVDLFAEVSQNIVTDAVQLIRDTDRSTIKTLVQMNQYVDLAIPRGGEGLIQHVCDVATVPVIKHYKGLCHLYIDEQANHDMAIEICVNAKCQRSGVCNAIETLLIHKQVAKALLPKLVAILENQGVECRGDTECAAILPNIKAATDADWDTEYLDLILSIKIVEDVNEAIAHINQHGSHHSDAIVSPITQHQQIFQQQVDSAAVYVNASTRYTDGAEFGMGAEIGISTDKIHARGPMGLNELTSYKYIIDGQGQIRR